MTYTKLYIVRGILIKEENLKASNYCKISGVYYHEPTRMLYTILHFPEDSKFCPDYVVVGEIVHTYYRNMTRCDECKDLLTCESCYNKTNNGEYEIVNITEKPTKVPKEHVCKQCGHDNRGKFDICACCSSGDQRDYHNQSGMVKSENDAHLMFAKDYKKPLAYYYMINDWLSTED